ncbi:hypothetical protein [Alteromonas sp. AO-Serp]|uniref:hypothetical protein n=1 Tax=Alteromonas sp. AO-Serp TaxID=2804349 RepID=UPI00257A6F33|nr:hypothetical protein [Alteromonas sp. AO-Serp]
MATLNFDGANGNYGDGFLQAGSWILEDGILRITGSAPSGDARILWESASNGSLTLRVLDPKTSPSYAAIFFRATDLNNGFHFLNRAQDNRLRLIKVIDGVTQSPDLLDITPAGIGGASNRTLSVELDGDTIRCFQNGTQVGGDITDTFNQNATLHGIRTGSADYDFDYITIPDPAVAATKSITFDLHQDLVGVSGVNFLISPTPLGDSITSGALDTSSSTVTIDLDAFPSVAAGETLMLIATDKQAANDDADIIAWSSATVTEA